MARSKPIKSRNVFKKSKKISQARQYSLAVIFKQFTKTLPFIRKRGRGRPPKKFLFSSRLYKRKIYFDKKIAPKLVYRFDLEKRYALHLLNKYASIVGKIAQEIGLVLGLHSVPIRKRKGVVYYRQNIFKRSLARLSKLVDRFTNQRKRIRFKNRIFKRLTYVWQQVQAELKEITTPQAPPPPPKLKQLRKAIKKPDLKLPQIDWQPFKIFSAPEIEQIWRWAISKTARYVYLSMVFSGIFLGGVYGIYVFVFQDLPSVNELVERDQIVTTRILDRDGELLFRIYEDENRTLVRLKEVPDHVIQATIAIEDQNFYEHQGFSVIGIVRAFVGNLQGKPIQGGSTITQQLVKNRLLTSERTIQRKLREVILAVLVDAAFTKEEILEMYLNQVAYGGATYGIEEASQTYFGKSVAELNLAEGAMLAGLPAAPSVYSPFGPLPELAEARQEEVLRRMVEDGYIDLETAQIANGEKLSFRANVIDIQAAHFVMYVRQLLANEYGETELNQGGLEVRTTLDLDLQNEAQKLVTSEVEKLTPLRVSNGAALVTNPETGEILAMVGSRDYFDFEHDGQVNVTLRPRQPGSSIKPLTYAVAMEQGKTPYTIINDSPITYDVAGSEPYSPQNYDGKFHGNVTLKQALGSSYNVPAVKMLAEIGVDNVINKGEAMGITTWKDRYRYGLSLTLGGGEVRMLDMAKVYGTFANDGYTVDLNPILEVKDSHGKILYRNDCVYEAKSCPIKRNLDPRVAYQINDILSDNNARTPAFGPQSVLNIPGQQVAVKTGTTNNLRDNWTIGYTTNRLVSVWVGNNDNTPMSYVASGITGASPIWNNIMRLLLDENNPHAFAQPTGLVKVSICTQTGTLPCNSCPTVKEEYFIVGTEPKFACSPSHFRPNDGNENQAQSNAVNIGEASYGQNLSGL